MRRSALVIRTRCAKSSDGRLASEVCHYSRPGPELGATVSAALGWIAVRMAELLVKSVIVELGAYLHPRAAPLLDAGADPARPGRYARRPTLAVRPADGLI